MAIMDAYLEFCDATSVGAAVATTVCGNVIDLGATHAWDQTKENIGDGAPVYLHARVNTACSTAGTGPSTLAFYLQSANTNTPASFSNFITLKAAAASKGTYIAGYKIYDGSLPSSTSYKRYLRIASTIAVSALSTGKIDAFLSLDPVD